MKVFVVSILFAVLSGATCSVVAWPGAVSLSARGFPLSAGAVPLSARAFPLSAGAVPVSASYVQNVVTPQVKAFGYSTSQYISSAPSSLSFGYQPQISYQSYQIPVSHYYPQQIQTYRPIVAPAYYPTTSLFYPTLSPAPVAPVSPVQRPQTEAPVRGDEDTAIVDSAEFPQQQTFAPQPQAPGNDYLPPTSAPAQEPSDPNPADQQMPSYPNPADQQMPSDQQNFPAADNNDQGLNDEDTISVESA
ncbi:cell division protein ZipA-like [Aricia agestis]|uniref:cell division protein ZipA-like n=1 Tax=Aricia agestis TaxID=91739 RepID=UPI001C2031F2|nr:cell division protein ZipA-like [Aricia agestis]